MSEQAINFLSRHIEHQDGDLYIAGHKFGFDHPTIHWVLNPRARKFSTSTTMVLSEAFSFSDRDKAFHHINNKVDKWNETEEHYIFYAVLRNTRTGKTFQWTSGVMAIL